MLKFVSQLDVVMFMSGIQHEYDFTHPEKVSLDGKHISKVSDRTNGFDVRCIDVATELETNYLSIVNMTHLFLPHLIKVGVREPPQLSDGHEKLTRSRRKFIPASYIL